MSLNNLRSSIKQISDIEVKNILKKGEEEVRKILSQAEKECKSISKKIYEEEIENLRKIQEAELKFAHSTWKKRIMETKYNTMEEIFVDAKNKLQKIIKKDEFNYLDVLIKLITEAVSKLPGKNFILIANRRDKRLLTQNLKKIEKICEDKLEREVKLKMGEEIFECMGGIIVYTDDMSLYYNNTFDARLEILKRDKWGELTEKLFKEVG